MENFEKLKLTQEDIREAISEVLKATNITPEAIGATIEGQIEKKLSDVDKGMAKILSQTLDPIDKRFKKPVGEASDYLILGNAEYDDKGYLMAIAYYETAILLRPDYVEAWYNKGASLYELHRYEKALVAYDRAIGLKHNYFMAWYNKGCVYSLTGDKENALRNLSAAIDLDPKCKEKAKGDKDFKSLWDDEDFKKIVS